MTSNDPEIKRERLAQWQAAQKQQLMPTSSDAGTPTTTLHGAGASRGVLSRIDALREDARLRREAAAAAVGASCADCCDTGWHYAQRDCDCPVGRENAQSRLNASRDEWLATVDDEVCIPRRYRRCTLETFPNQASPVLTALREWLAGDQDRGIYLHGEFGRGKTGLMLALLRDAVVSRGAADGYQRRARGHAQFVTGTGMLQSLRPGGDEDDTAKVLRGLCNTSLLVIDDLGAERLTDWGADRVFEIVNSRHNDERPTLVTSNLPADQLAARITKQVGMQMGDRIVERLVESCDLLSFSPNDPNWRMA